MRNKDKPKELTENKIHQKNVEVSRFGRSTMDVSLTIKNEKIYVITKRLTADNVDWLTSILSYNCCKNYLGVLAKFSEV